MDHPNVVEVFDFVESADRAPIMVMELLQGETLAARLARGSLPVRELSRTLLPVVSAVGTAHARGIVHRDRSPRTSSSMSGRKTAPNVSRCSTSASPSGSPGEGERITGCAHARARRSVRRRLHGAGASDRRSH